MIRAHPHRVRRDATRRLAAALAAHLEAGDVVVLVGDSARARRRSRKGIARGLGVDGPVTSPTFTLVQEYAGRLPVAHVDVYRLERIQELHDLGFDELVDGAASRSSSGATRSRSCFPPDHVVVRIEPGDADDERALTVDVRRVRDWQRRATLERVARARGASAGAQEAGGPDAGARHRHRDAPGRRRARVGARAARPRSSSAAPIGATAPRHAELLAPAIDVRCASRPGSRVDHLSAIAVGVGPGMFTGLRVGVTTAKVLAQALRIPVIPIPSLDLLAYPLRHSRALVVPAIDARRHEVYYALYRPRARRRAARLRVRDRHARGARRRARGARRGSAAVRRRRAALRGGVRRARPRRARRHRACGAEPVGARRARRRAVRARGVLPAGRGAADVPAQERRRDLAGRPGARDGRAAQVARTARGAHRRRCGAGICESVLRIEQQVYPRRGRIRCSSASSRCARRARTSSRRSAATSSGTPA